MDTSSLKACLKAAKEALGAGNPRDALAACKVRRPQSGKSPHGERASEGLRAGSPMARAVAIGMLRE
jgi:hypothetical protein